MTDATAARARTFVREPGRAYEVRDAQDEEFAIVPTSRRAFAIVDLLNRGELDHALRLAGKPTTEDVIRNG